jgi:hypothetical protein
LPTHTRPISKKQLTKAIMESVDPFKTRVVWIKPSPTKEYLLQYGETMFTRIPTKTQYQS